MKPFRELRVIRWGEYSSDAWTYKLTVRRSDSAQLMRGNRKGILIDREFAAAHQGSLQGFFENAMGLCHLEARRDGLYAVRIDWKPDAVEALERDEFAYLVPAFVIGKTGRAERLISLALTNTAIAGFPRIEELL